jgi:hypothetical protein
VHRSCDAVKDQISSDGDDSDSKKVKQGYGGAWQSLESGCMFYVGVIGRNLALIAVKLFSHLSYF